MLNEQQIKFILENAEKSNAELADIMEVSPNLIGGYKSRARKAGVFIPLGNKGKRYKPKNPTVTDDIKRIAEEIK